MTTTLSGVGIGRGIAIGPVVRMPDPLPEPSEIRRLRQGRAGDPGP